MQRTLAMARNSVSRAAKRTVDLAVAVPALVLLTPLAALVAVAVALRIGRPVLFRHQRPGLGGKPFTMLKFRTMTDERDSRGSPLPDRERLTGFGQWLRSTSIDEIPELLNVIRGEMSLVGPRPLLMQYLGRYSPEQLRRHEVRPGITGWAQVNGRIGITWGERIELDDWYVEHRSPRLDLRILARTVAHVVSGRGLDPG